MNDAGQKFPARDENVKIGEVELHVTTAGAGHSVLLLHGFPDSGRLWRRQIESLSRAGYNVIAPDLRGFGESSRPAEVAAYRMPLLIGDVVALLDRYGVERAAVVGHDWGAALAWQLAMAVPDRVERLVVASVGHPAAGRGIEQRRLSWYMLWFLFEGVAERELARNDWQLFREWGWDGAQPGADPDCDRQIADLSRPGALLAALNWYRANIRPESYFTAAAPAAPPPPISCPTMGIWSSGDNFLGEAQMRESSAFVSGSWRYERLACDHWIPAHAPGELDELLLDFFA
jgi:pimeloyl-ACP methyl ester carboxylesterase